MLNNASFLEYTLAHELSAPRFELELESGVHMELWETGILRVIPHAGPMDRVSSHRVIVSCGIHGNETAPMELLDQLVNEITLGQLDVRNELLFIIGNPVAANKAQRFVDENLNRLFAPSLSTQSDAYEAKRAELIKRVTQRFFSQGDESRLHYDLHTAIRGSQFEKFAVYPFLHERKWSQHQIGFLEACGLEALLLSNKPSSTYSYYTSSEYKSDSFTVELGSVKPFGENDMTNFAEIIDGLRSLISDQQSFERQPRRIQAFAVVEEVIKLSDAFKLHFPEDAKNFTEFQKGSLLASDDGYEYRTRQDGERFVFPIINVPVGQRAMLVVAPTKLS